MTKTPNSQGGRRAPRSQGPDDCSGEVVGRVAVRSGPTANPRNRAGSRTGLLAFVMAFVLVTVGCREQPEASPPSAPASATASASATTASTPGPPSLATHREIPALPDHPLDPALRRGVEEARSRVAATPDSAETWGAFGQWCEAAELLTEARVAYARAAELDPSSPRWPHLLGLLQLQDDFDDALRHLERAVTLGAPTNEASRVRLAQALVERGRADDARPHLEALVATRSDHAAARLEQARLHLASQRLPEATQALAPCLTNPYTARPAVLLLAQIRAREGRADEASTLARRGSAMPRPFDWPDPFQREVQALRSDRARQAERIQGLLGQRRFAEADAALAQLIAGLSDDPELLLLAGRSLLQQRRCPDAEARFREHLRVAPDSLNGRIQLALALLCQQRWADAAAVLEQAIALKPDFAQAHANLGLARSRLGDGPGALRAYREALRCSPGDPSHHAALAEEYLRAGQSADARRHATDALRFDPNQPRARAVLERLKPDPR